MTDSLKDKVAVVTGGASGIGQATAQLFASEGARVAIFDVNEEGGQQSVEAIRSSRGKAIFIRVDMSHAAEVEAAVCHTIEATVSLDVIFNGAGGSGRRWGDGPTADCTDEGWEKTIALNLKSVFLGCKFALPEMLKAERGAIVNLSSVLGLVGGDADFATHAYAASKGGIISLTRSIAADYAPQHIRANVICPGLIATPMSRRAQSDEHIHARLSVLQPLTADFGQPIDVANAALYLASDQSKFVTGAVLTVVGSYAWPAWFITAVEAMKRGDYGPADMQETLNDAVDVALHDQVEAGVDIVSDGEMRRLGFFTADFYNRLTGLRTLSPDRLLGPAGHDQREHYEAIDHLAASDELGLVAEFQYARTRTAKQIKLPCPGPFTLAGRIAPGSIYRDRMAVAQTLADIINAELKALVDAGVDFIQLDEPSYAVHPDAARQGTERDFVEVFNHTVEGVNARIGLHLCFGNFVGRPVAKRTYAPLFPHILDTRTDELALEFANREMFEIEIGRQVAEAGKTLAASLIDVKNDYIETPEDVAQR